MTEAALKRMKEKLAHLKAVLPEYAKETQQAAALGDRSDNFEYKDAKSRLTRTHFQIFNTQDQIKRAVIIPSGKNTSGIVRLGSSVILKMSRGLETFRILGAHETNPSLGRISFQSPLGAALMNHKKGDIVTIQTPNGPKKYIIIDVK